LTTDLSVSYQHRDKLIEQPIVLLNKLNIFAHYPEYFEYVLRTPSFTGMIALEIKSGQTRSSSGLSAFKNAFKPSKILLIGNTGLSWQDFLKMNPVELF